MLSDFEQFVTIGQVFNISQSMIVGKDVCKTCSAFCVLLCGLKVRLGNRILVLTFASLVLSLATSWSLVNFSLRPPSLGRRAARAFSMLQIS